MNVLSSIRRLALVAGFAVAATLSHAIVFSGNWNAAGYAVDQFTVSGGVAHVEVFWIGGFGDASLALFDGSGNQVALNDDYYGFDPFIGIDLASGSYSVLSTYCCALFGGQGTLGGMTAYLDTIPYGFAPGGGEAYSILISPNGNVSSSVPDSGVTALLLGVALLGFGATRRKLSLR